MKKLFLSLTLSAVLAPAMLLAQDPGTVQVEAQPQSRMQEMQSDFEMQMAKLRAEQQAKMNEFRAQEEARLAEEQAKMAEMRAERNAKIVDLQSQLMALETERASEMSSTGARVVNGLSLIHI